MGRRPSSGAASSSKSENISLKQMLNAKGKKRPNDDDSEATPVSSEEDEEDSCVMQLLGSHGGTWGILRRSLAECSRGDTWRSV